MIFARKINIIPELACTICARKIPEFYIIIARKIFFPSFREGTCPPSLPLPPVSYAYASMYVSIVP